MAEQIVDRRRVLTLTAPLVLGLATGHATAEHAYAAKRDDDTGKKGKRNEKKRKKTKKKQSASGKAAKVVKEAKKHKGAKYKWGGESPTGFDCSGLVWYAYEKAAGLDIGRTVKDQYKKGKSVGRDSWKPGDVVFFKNTFEHGLSHNGIYISGNKFIHAENEKTGVVISSLDSGYYKDHYAGARRML